MASGLATTQCDVKRLTRVCAELDGSYFAYVDKALTWDEAAEYARTMQAPGSELRGHLMIVPNAQEQALAVELANGRPAWLGG